MTSSAKSICRLYIGIRNLMLILAFILVVLKVCHCHAENLGPVHIPIEIHIPNKEEIAEYYKRECEEHKREQERKEEDRQAEKENDRDERFTWWYDAEKIYPPSTGRVLIYAINGHFKAWTYVN